MDALCTSALKILRNWIISIESTQIMGKIKSINTKKLFSPLFISINLSKFQL